MHAAGAPGLRVQGALENGAEDGGADVGPVEVLAGLREEQVIDLLVEGGDLDVLVGEKAAVHIGEGGQQRIVVPEIGVPLVLRLVQDPETDCAGR